MQELFDDTPLTSASQSKTILGIDHLVMREKLGAF